MHRRNRLKPVHPWWKTRRFLYNRRACSALQGLGGWATNKQRAKSPTFALLATTRIDQKNRLFAAPIPFQVNTIHI